LENTLKPNEMKSKKTELDVDFIGGMGALTSQEEKSLSEYFKKRKHLSSKTGKSRKPKLAV
jgi:hypothetical protein